MKTPEEIIQKHCNTRFSTRTGNELVESSMSSVCIAMEEYAAQSRQDAVDEFYKEVLKVVMRGADKEKVKKVVAFMEELIKPKPTEI